ncbi:hypothetical protein ILUMI_06121 [Ignelater luminosus]|uniref:Uncharacterized protein n=1 Tax=Ignelater luminosus TaxID=2038154 RepID=A0A8K0D5W0_IGNLU|nr:hypothetical protein ILUMI_06121 [Ignelater luminosus]
MTDEENSDGNIIEEVSFSETPKRNKDGYNQAKTLYTSAFDSNLEILVVQWSDSVVTMMTNSCTLLTLVSAKRYKMKERKDEAIKV